MCPAKRHTMTIPLSKPGRTTHHARTSSHHVVAQATSRAQLRLAPTAQRSLAQIVRGAVGSAFRPVAMQAAAAAAVADCQRIDNLLSAEARQRQVDTHGVDGWVDPTGLILRCRQLSKWRTMASLVTEAVIQWEQAAAERKAAERRRNLLKVQSVWDPAAHDALRRPALRRPGTANRPRRAAGGEGASCRDSHIQARLGDARSQ